MAGDPSTVPGALAVSVLIISHAILDMLDRNGVFKGRDLANLCEIITDRLREPSISDQAADPVVLEIFASSFEGRAKEEVATALKRLRRDRGRRKALGLHRPKAKRGAKKS